MQRSYGSQNANQYFHGRYCQEQSPVQNRQKSFKANSKIPINLLRKIQRERRYHREPNKIKKKSRKFKKRKVGVEQREHEALVQTTEMEIRRILEQTELLSDIPYDCTPEELLGEISLAKGTGTTVYIQRDGLSTLTIVLPQLQPTIANLKRAIESTARVQLKRELRERHAERMRRRSERAPIATKTITRAIAFEEHNDDQQVVVTGSSTAAASAATTTTPATTTMVVPVEPIKSTGELVYSTARSGHHHRPNVSWRFLWRAYALFNVDTNLPLNDANGRTLLSECGVENASTLKFCNREKYFGRKRQK